MKLIRFTLIEGGNSDPAPLSDASHPKLVDASFQPPTTAESVNWPLLLKLIDAMIGFVVRIGWSFESFRKNLKQRQGTTGGDSKKTVVAGRLGW